MSVTFPQMLKDKGLSLVHLIRRKNIGLDMPNTPGYQASKLRAWTY